MKRIIRAAKKWLHNQTPARRAEINHALYILRNNMCTDFMDYGYVEKVLEGTKYDKERKEAHEAGVGLFHYQEHEWI